MTYDFSGWATRNNIKCSDGRTIMKDAFKDCDGKTVPLVWDHNHSGPSNILGHALMQNRAEGVYVYCSFNESEAAKEAKELIKHGDISALSIFANNLKEKGHNVIHGMIREVSLVLAGANPGAFIDTVLSHSDSDEGDDAVIYTGEEIALYHSDDGEKKKDEEDKKDDKKDNKDDEEDSNDETVEDVYNSLNEKQKNVVDYLVSKALEEGNNNNDDEEGGEDKMKHNIFDTEETTGGDFLIHSGITFSQDSNDKNSTAHTAMEVIIADAKRYGSLKESFLAHADEYGIEHIDYLFPDAKTLNNTPEFIKRDMDWVAKVMGAVHSTPFSRIKSVFADITEDAARAKGYIKGKKKKEEVFSLLKRTTSPVTVYKKQKLDRDDVVDITDFDVVAWLKTEMRMMLDEELARAILVGDGRLPSDDDHINEQNIRPIWTDDDLYTIKKQITLSAGADESDKAKAFIKNCIKARKEYKGSGNPTLFTTEDMLTDCLLLTDTTGRDLYDSVEKLATKLRVKEIITIPVLENLTREVDSTEYELGGIITNLTDYNVGADKGGSINMFEDFDIDYNQQKYLIETRCSGALVKPFAAIAIEFTTSSNPQ